VSAGGEIVSLKYHHPSQWQVLVGAQGDEARRGYSGRSLLVGLGFASGLMFWLGNMPAIASPLLAQTPSPTQAQAQTIELFVNPTMGNDASGNGSQQAPFKTITQALRMAGANTVIILAPGTYSAESGESFPIELKPGAILQGDPASKGRNVIIRGGGFFLSRTFARQNIAILGADESGLAGVTVTNPNRRGYGLWIESSNLVVADNSFIGNTHDGISVTGNSAPLIRNNYFADNGANGMTIFNTARPEVRENVFERTGFGMTIAQNAAPLVIGNRIVQNKDGIVANGKSQPMLRSNTIEGNLRDGLVATQESRPDIGTTGQPGGNLFRNNRRYDINTTASIQTVPAVGNQLARNRIVGRLDLGGGSVTNPPLATVRTGEVRLNSSQPLPRTNSPASVIIPVPPPQTTPQQDSLVARRRRGNRRRVTRQRRNIRRLPPPPSNSRAIPIEVVPAPDGNAIQSRVQPTTPGRDTLPSLTVQPGMVPSPGGIPPVNSRNLPPVGEPSNTTALGARYRVLVLLENLNQVTQLRSLVPDAERIPYQGRLVMQVGVYRDRAQAEEMFKKMTNNGFSTTIDEF
jgi:parallel beta-helix repeat protein